MFQPTSAVTNINHIHLSALHHGNGSKWPNLMYNPSTCLQGLRKAMVNLHQDCQCPSQVSNQASLWYVPEALPLEPNCSVQGTISLVNMYYSLKCNIRSCLTYINKYIYISLWQVSVVQSHHEVYINFAKTVSLHQLFFLHVTWC
jgi:hypothetical protein